MDPRLLRESLYFLGGNIAAAILDSKTRGGLRWEEKQMAQIVAIKVKVNLIASVRNAFNW